MQQKVALPPSLILANAMNGLVIGATIAMLVRWGLGVLGIVEAHTLLKGIHLSGGVVMLMLSVAAILPYRVNAVAQALAAGVIAFSVFGIAEYALHLSTAVDHALQVSGILPEVVRKGWRIGFAPATCALLAGLSVMLQRRRSTDPVTNAIAFASPSVALLVALHSYFIAPYNLGFQDYSPLRTMTAPGLVLVVLFCGALIIRGWYTLLPAKVQRLDHAIAWCTLGLTALVLVSWDYEERSAWNDRRYETAISLASGQHALADFIENLGMSQKRLAGRWDIYGTPTPEQWQHDALAMRNGYPILSGIAWMDVTRKVRWQVVRNPMTPSLIGLSVEDYPALEDTLNAVALAGIVRMSPQVILPGKIPATLIVAPVSEHGTLRGNVIATLTAADLRDTMSGLLSTGFDFVIRDDGVELAGTAPDPEAPGTALQKSAGIFAFGRSWTLTVWPTAEYIASRQSRLQVLSLAFGLVAAWMVGLTLIQTRRGRINQTLAESLATKLATTLDHISDGFMTMDRSWRITYANKQAASLINRPQEELIGSSLPNYGEDFDASVRAVSLNKAMEQNRTERFEIRIPTTGHWMDVTAYPAEDGAAIHFRDITEERERAEHLHLLETAVSRQNDVLIIAQADGGERPQSSRIVYVNDAFTRLTGYTRDEVIGRRPNMLQGPKTDKTELARIGKALARREPVFAELLNYTKDGREYWIEIDITPILDDKGQCTHFVAIERDVTRRRAVQQEMLLAQERFHQIAEATNDIVWDADIIKGTIWFNENFRLILGRDPDRDAPTLKDWEALVHPEDLPRVLQALNDAVAAKASQVVTDYRIARVDGSYATVVDRAKIIRDEDGKVIRLVGTMADVTEQRAMASRLHQSQQLEVIGHLTGGVAHDFNNLLTVILGSAELLSERLEDQPRLKKLAETAITAALRGSDMTYRLLAFARRQPLDPKVVDIANQLDAVRDWLSSTLPESIHVDIATDPELWRIEADPTQLETALLNLAVNSRDAMPEGGQLVIRAANRSVAAGDFPGIPEAVPGDYVCISVTDTGIGMDADTIAHAFEPFFTTKPMGKGSGLGLSMVYGFVRQSSGFALIESAPGKGTTVSLCFPRSASHQAERAEKCLPADTPGGDEHILVVEDDDMLRENVVVQLGQLGYKVSAAPAGSAALVILQDETDIDLLFSDVVMPGDMNGPELVSRALAVRPGLKVLYTSGYSDEAIIHGGRLDAGVSLLTKPYRMAEMARKVRTVLDA